MPNDKKKYVMTAVVLASIGAGSGLLIAGANLLTASIIEQNEINRTNKGLQEIFANATFEKQEDEKLGNTQYLVSYYLAKDGESTLGYVFQTNGNNMYGNIAMLVGLVYNSAVSNYESKSIYLVNNTQTYATEVVENYVNPFNAGENPDVKCGATYAARLIKAMVDESVSFANENLKEGN